MWLWLLPLAVIALGCYVTYRDQRVHITFKPTRGKITCSEVVATTHIDPVETPTYFANIRFSYSIGRKSYINGKYSLHQNVSTSRARFEKLCQQFPLGSYHEAWYDPVNPDFAVLDKGKRWTGIMVIIGGLIIAIAIFISGKWR